MMKQEREEIQADKEIPAAEKDQLIKEIDEALKQTKPIENPENIDLVKKHSKALENAMQ